MVQACAAVDRLPERTRIVPGAGMLALLPGLLLLGLLLALAPSLMPKTPAGPPAVDDAEPLVLTLGPGGRDLRLHGDFDEGAAERVRALLDANPGIERVHLTSDGGFVDEARAIGAMIAARGLATYVPDTCVSACTLAFVSGRARFMVREAKLGFHAPFETDDSGREVQVDSTEERRDYVTAGLAPDFIDAALGTPSAEIWFPDVDRLRAAGAVTEVVDTGRFPDSTLDGGATPARARSTVLRNVPLLAALGPAHAVVDEIAAWYLAGYRAGRSEADALAGLRTLTARAVRDALTEADTEVVSGFGRLIVEALAATTDDEGCAEIGLPADAVAVDEALRREGHLQAAQGLASLVTHALNARAIHVHATDADTPVQANLNAMECRTLRARYADALVHASATPLRDILFGGSPSRTPQREASALVTSR